MHVCQIIDILIPFMKFGRLNCGEKERDIPFEQWRSFCWENAQRQSKLDIIIDGPCHT